MIKFGEMIVYNEPPSIISFVRGEGLYGGLANHTMKRAVLHLISVKRHQLTPDAELGYKMESFIS